MSAQCRHIVRPSAWPLTFWSKIGTPVTPFWRNFGFLRVFLSSQEPVRTDGHTDGRALALRRKLLTLVLSSIGACRGRGVTLALEPIGLARPVMVSAKLNYTRHSTRTRIFDILWYRRRVSSTHNYYRKTILLQGYYHAWRLSDSLLHLRSRLHVK